MARDPQRHLDRMYERDMVRWRQGRGPMPSYADYIPDRRKEGCFGTVLRMLGYAIVGIGAPVLVVLVAIFLMKFVFGMVMRAPW